MAGKGRRSADGALAVVLAQGATWADAAGQVGVSERTVGRRLSDPLFRARVSRFRTALLDRAVGQAAEAATEAVETLRRLLRSDHEMVQLGAARSLLSHVTRLRESVELEERLSEIERSIAVR